MKKIISQLTAIVALLFTVNANAGLLKIDFSNEIVNVGETVTVTISAQDFSATESFGFDLNFDNSMLAYDDMSLTSDLLLVDSAMGFFDGLEVTSFGFGLAFDFWDFIVLAEGDFVLASFDLIATTAGVSNFSLTGFDRDYAPSDYPIVFSTDSVTVLSLIHI